MKQPRLTFPKPGSRAREALDADAARTQMYASHSEHEHGPMAGHGVPATKTTVQRFSRRAKQAAAYGLNAKAVTNNILMARVLEIVRDIEAKEVRRVRIDTLQDCTAVWVPVRLDNETQFVEHREYPRFDAAVTRGARSERLNSSMEQRTRAAFASAGGEYSRGEVHPYESRVDLLTEFLAMNGRQKSVWRRQCSACFSSIRPWQRWPTWAAPPQTGKAGKALRKSKNTLLADDEHHRFGQVDEARIVFEAFETPAEQRHAVTFFEQAEGSAPTWAIPRTQARPGPKPRKPSAKREATFHTRAQAKRKAAASKPPMTEHQERTLAQLAIQQANQQHRAVVVHPEEVAALARIREARNVQR